MILLDSYFENEREAWGPHVFCTDLCPDSVFHGFKFSPVIARGSIAFNSGVGHTLKSLGYPDLRWPFNDNPNIYNYGALLNYPDILNHDAKIFNAVHTLACFHFSDRLWIRSAAGNKAFSGGVFTKEEFLQELEYLEQKGLSDMVFAVASPKKVHKEYRLVVVDNAIISSSLYMVDGSPKQGEHAPYDVLSFANVWFANSFSIPNNVVIDVSDDLKIIEINPLLTSGWYSCDVEAIVSAIKNVYEKVCG